MCASPGLTRLRGGSGRYPVTWDVLRYISLLVVSAIVTGLKGTIFSTYK